MQSLGGIAEDSVGDNDVNHISDSLGHQLADSSPADRLDKRSSLDIVLLVQGRFGYDRGTS